MRTICKNFTCRANPAPNNKYILLFQIETLKEYRDRFQYFPTPEKLADRLVELAEIDDIDKVLEPSAGRGRIVEAIYRNNPYCNLSTVELNPEYMESIQSVPQENKYTMDFLEFVGHKFDIIIMNPPFTKSQDIKHIMHAYSLL